MTERNPADMTDAEYMRAIADKAATLPGPEVAAHVERLRAIAARLEPKKKREKANQGALDG